MEGKFEVNRLDSVELKYELRVRGFNDDVGVDEGRKKLRAYLKMDADSSVTYPKYPFSFEEDSGYLKGKLAELTALVEDFADLESSSAFKKINSKLIHAYGRAQRSNAKTEEEIGIRTNFMMEFLSLQSTLRSKARKYKKLSLQGEAPIDFNVVLSSTGLESSDEESLDEANPVTPMSRLNLSAEIPAATRVKGIPVAKWQLEKFSGDTSKVSLNAFLERVEELRVSRNVTREELLASASDLFVGKALIWFRAIRAKLPDWSSLVSELRAQFQPPNYNERLFEEIKHRTQGPNENIGMYLAIMSSMFDRLTVPLHESSRLKILLRNIAPFYQSQLGLVSITSIDQLLTLGRQLEARKESIESFVSPPRNRSNLVEPDLAYVYSGSDHATTSTHVSLICWNCQQSGHRSNQCSAPRKKHCFKCGTEGQTSRTCPKCNKDHPNGNRN